MPDTSFASSLKGLCGSFLAICSLIVGLRLYIRKWQRLPWGVDDLILIPCLVLYIASCVTIFVGVHLKVLGYSSHSFTEAEQIAVAESSAKVQIAWDIFSICTLACVKLSAIFFYRRIFCVSGRKSAFGLTTMVFAVVIVFWMVIFCFLTGFQCHTHFSALWDGTYMKYCTITFPFLYGLAVSDLLLDVFILVLPISQVVKLRMSIKQKIATIGVFLFALVGVGASITRVVVFARIENAGPTAYLKYDTELTSSEAIYFSTLEAGMSIIAVNLPSLWFLCSKKGREPFLRSIRSFLSISSSGASSTTSREDFTSSHNAHYSHDLPASRTICAKDSLPSFSSQVGLAKHAKDENAPSSQTLNVHGSDEEMGVVKAVTRVGVSSD